MKVKNLSLCIICIHVIQITIMSDATAAATATAATATATATAATATATATAVAVRAAGLDKFYTVDGVVQTCINLVGSKWPWTTWGLVVEPSAGNGSFLFKLPTTKRIGIDIAPEHADILAHDFLTWQPSPEAGEKVLVIGNPPFGRVCSLAIKFFNHAATFASVIAFIIPRTFRRVSVQNKLCLDFHLVSDIDIPMSPCAFEPPMAAKCCFQIWAKREGIAVSRAVVTLATVHKDWDFLGFGPNDKGGQPTPPVGADFALRAYGGACGEIVSAGLQGLRPKSWHWIKAKNTAEGGVGATVLVQRFKNLDYGLSKNTARQNSIGRGELVKLYSQAFT